jgi:hypothetical protein
MKIINSENNKSLIFSNAQSPRAIILINLKDPYIYLLMGLNDYLDLLAEVDGATSISTISLVDMAMESFPPYIYVPISWAKHTKDYHRGALSWEISRVVNYIFSSFSCRRPTKPPGCFLVSIRSTPKRRRRGIYLNSTV